MNGYAYAILATGWLAWLVAFLSFRRNGVAAQEVDRRARWGMLLAAIAYSMLWQGPFWKRSVAAWQVALSILFFLLAAILSWTAKHALGRQWRIDAGLNTDHELVVSGPYRVLRHPIYTLMLCALLGTGVLITPWRLLSLSLVVLLAGTEIRVRIEDRLLLSRFGDPFRNYQRRVRAYIPFLR